MKSSKKPLIDHYTIIQHESISEQHPVLDESGEYYDLSGFSKQEKQQIQQDLIKELSENMLSLYRALNLQEALSTQITDPINQQAFELTFKPIKKAPRPKLRGASIQNPGAGDK